jgi:hypothetical protein
VGLGTAVVEIVAGVVEIYLALTSTSIQSCMGWQYALVLDGVLFIATGGLELNGNEDQAKAVAVTALVVFGIWILGWLYFHFTC